jgi:hypothetical protein
LKHVIADHTEIIVKALYDDFKKPAEEAIIEVGPILDEIDFVCASLDS